MGGELHLALEGQEQHGIRITSSTSLSYVRIHFPVPAGYIFGVPQRLEDRFKATDFLPLMLLRAEDCLQGRLGSTSAPADHKAERDRLEYECAQLRETLARARDGHASKYKELLSAKEALEREVLPLRARAHEADALETAANALRERQSQLEEEAKESKQMVQRESHKLIARLAEASREATRAKAAAASAEREVAALREQLVEARGMQQQLIVAKCAALSQGASALRAAYASLRADVQRQLAEAGGELRSRAAEVSQLVSGAYVLEMRAAAAAKGAEQQGAAARAEAAGLRAEVARLRGEGERCRAEGDEARAELKRLKAERRQQSADLRRRESAASSDASKAAAELLATREQAAARERELRKAKAEADAQRLAWAERERSLGDELAAVRDRLRQSDASAAELSAALSAARASADAARQAQDEAEAAWAEAGGRRPVSFAEYIELRREVQQLALAGREFFVAPDSSKQQALFLTHVARVETMLTGARDGPATARAAASAGLLPITQSTGMLARASSLANVSAGAAPRDRPPLDPQFVNQRRSSVGSAGGPGAGSHLYQMQGLRAKRQLKGTPIR